MRVEEIMTKDVITVSPKTPIHEAAELMIDHGVSGLPVVDDAGSVVGIVTQAKDGVLSLWGLVLTETEKSAVETMARTIEGSKGIDSHLVVKSEFPYRYAV